jgi:hypothetical protein
LLLCNAIIVFPSSRLEERDQYYQLPRDDRILDDAYEIVMEGELREFLFVYQR